MFVIHKSSRLPDPIHGTYQGNAWYEAGIYDQYMQFYNSKELAEHLANELNKVNTVGFVVSEI